MFHGASIKDAEQAGAVEPYEDAALYDWEYRRRRNDIAFYRMLAAERGGPVLDLGCGTGRIATQLIRDGHAVVGIDLSAAMLARASARLRRIGRGNAQRYLLMQGNLKALPVRGYFPLAVAAFHTVQHLTDDGDLVTLFRNIRRLIHPDGWFAFDLFSPAPSWLARAANREYDRTVFRHPTTGQKVAYSVSHSLDRARRALHVVFHYQPVRTGGEPSGRGKLVRLCHRQLPPADIEKLLRRGGLEIIARWGGFQGEALATHREVGGRASVTSDDEPTEQHVYLTRATRVGRSK